MSEPARWDGVQDWLGRSSTLLMHPALGLRGLSAPLTPHHHHLCLTSSAQWSRLPTAFLVKLLCKGQLL